MPEELTKQEAENSLLLFGSIEQIAAIFVANAIFVAGFEAEELGHFEHLLHVHAVLVG